MAKATSVAVGVFTFDLFIKEKKTILVDNGLGFSLRHRITFITHNLVYMAVNGLCDASVI